MKKDVVNQETLSELAFILAFYMGIESTIPNHGGEQDRSSNTLPMGCTPDFVSELDFQMDSLCVPIGAIDHPF
jgi:hypothetical protein